MSQGGGDFSLSDEILAVIPTDPYDQLDLARKITSMAIASRVSNLESQVSGLRQKLLEKDGLVHELEDRVSSFERLYQEADSRLKNVVDENMKLTQERDSLAITSKKLGRDYAKLEAFKRQLMQSLNDDNPSQNETAHIRMQDENSDGLSGHHSYSNTEGKAATIECLATKEQTLGYKISSCIQIIKNKFPFAISSSDVYSERKTMIFTYPLRDFSQAGVETNTPKAFFLWLISDLISMRISLTIEESGNFVVGSPTSFAKTKSVYILRTQTKIQ